MTSNASRILRLAPALVSLVFVVASLFTAVEPAYALDRRTGTSVVIGRGEVVNDDLFAATDSVTIGGTVHGDVIAVGRDVEVTGHIDGDLIVLARHIVINGSIGGNVRAAGSLVDLEGSVDRNVSSAGANVRVGSSGRIAGSFLGAADDLSLDGDIGRAIAVAAQSVELAGRVGGGAQMAISSPPIFGPNAHIGGDLTYFAKEPLPIADRAVGGTVHYEHVERNRSYRPSPTRQLQAALGFFSIAWLIGSAIVGLFLVRMFPRFLAEFLHVIAAEPLPSFGIGVVTLIATIPVAVLVAITIVGIPISVLLVGGFFAGIFAGWLFLAVAVGSILVGLLRRGRPWHASWAFLLGLIVLALLTHIPILGGLLTVVFWCLGLGALIVSLHHTWLGGRAAAATALP